MRQRWTPRREQRHCPICDRETRLVEHHVSYERDETIKLCKECHARVHSDVEPFYDALKPDIPREEAEERGLV